MEDLEQCRTQRLGGQLYWCQHCQAYHYSYHSCKNRHCPKCQNDHAQQWLERQKSLLLPVPPFMVTFTLPEDLRALARRHQQVFYNILFRSAAEARQALAWDPRFIGGSLGMVGVLHTWARDLRYHPHVHYSVPGGGLAADGRWLSPPATTFWSTSSRGRCCSGPSSETTCKRPTCSRSWLRRSGTRTGGYTVSRLAVGKKPFDIWRLTSFGWPSATTASSRCKRATSPFNTRTRPPTRSQPVRCLPKSLCAVFFSTCCPPDSSRCAITACSAPPTVMCSTGLENSAVPAQSTPIPQVTTAIA
jgi:Transposase zinc-binding domain/Putative transposase